jgi:hypothetical protein
MDGGGMPDEGWRAIETAPHDGTEVRLRRIHEGRVVSEGWAYFGRRDPRHENVRQSAGGAMDQEDRWCEAGGQHFFPGPTHWRQD